MSYAIGYVVFGIDLCQSYYEEFHSKDWFQELVECEAIDSRYSGSGSDPYWLGAHLTTIDEASNVDLDKLFQQCEVTPAHEAAVAMAIKQIADNYPDTPDSFVDLLCKDKPTRFITWGTS